MRQEPGSLAAQREAARLTEERINQIESEMMSTADTTPMGPLTAARAEAPTLPAPPRAVRPPAAPAGGRAPGGGEPTTLGDPAAAMAIDVNGSSLPSVLEEAAILYSNDQPQPAALSLQHALADVDLGGYKALGWLMLLDLHQMAGDRAAFEALAIDYAARFETSPPSWSAQLEPKAPPAKPVVNGALINLPAKLDASLGDQLERVIRTAGNRREVVLDATQVDGLDLAAARALLRLLKTFDKGPATLLIRGAEELARAAQDLIESGRRDADESGWMLALQLLRVLGQQQPFEDLSIEYCVTYEVSPPSWEPPGAFVRMAGTAAGAGAGDGKAAALESASASAPRRESESFALRGDVLGRMQSELNALRAFAAGRNDIVIDCRALRRMEFLAAGDLLNEVVVLKAAGKSVLFVEPNYLVYALMLVMGIQELAEIRRRKI
ncbi:MAG: hypothetical protein AB7L76_18150 [Burkholderiaceae bacterium]